MTNSLPQTVGSPPSRLAAVLYADVAGYSRLTEADELGTHRQLSSSLDLIAERIRSAGGEVIHYAGDAVLASFPSVVAATHCAVSIQQAIAALAAHLPEDRRLLYRMGINVGEVIIDRDDIYGDGVNVAARLEGLADPGGICVSETVFEQVRDRVDVRFEEVGERRVKNISRPVRVYRLAPPAVPGARTDAVAAAVSRVSAYSSLVAADNPEAELARRFAEAPPSIFILPFRNLGDASNEPLVEGFRLSIQASLVKLPGLFLVNVPVANLLAASDLSATQAGNAAGIRYVLEGSVQTAGARMRITVQLTDAVEGKVLWAQTYDRTIDDIFEVQDEVSTEVAAELEGSLYLGGEMTWWKNLSGRAAREYVLRAISHMYKGTAADTAQARSIMEELLILIPDEPQAQALLAFLHWREVFQGWADRVEESLSRAEALAHMSIEGNDVDGLAHMVLAAIQLERRRHDEALALSEHASGMRSSCPMANAIRSKVLLYCGRPDEAVEAALKAVRLQRLYPPWMASLVATAYRDAGRLDAAVSVAEEMLRMDGDDLDGHVVLCSCRALGGDTQAASRAAGEILRIQPSFRVSAYLDDQPYLDPTRAESVGNALRGAGLPE